MASKSKIEWCDATWNPVRGCARVSPGCEHCYAERLAGRFNGSGLPYEGLTRKNKAGLSVWTGEAREVKSKLFEPRSWRRRAAKRIAEGEPRYRVFVNSMSDLFHPNVSFSFIAAVFYVMWGCGGIDFLVLTKRPARMFDFFEWHSHQYYVAPPLPNVHLGVSCEDQRRADERIPLLLNCPAAVRWVSAEPLLGPIKLPRGLDWVVVGGESGPGSRPCDVAWIQSIVEQCDSTPVFVKQLGSGCPGPGVSRVQPDSRPWHGGRASGSARRPWHCQIFWSYDDKKGADMSEWPGVIRVREFPSRARIYPEEHGIGLPASCAPRRARDGDEK